MCGNATPEWYQEDGISYFGIPGMTDAWLGKLEPDGGLQMKTRGIKLLRLFRRR